MAEKKKAGNMLKCPGCGAVKDSIFKSAICPRCGQIAVVPPLTDGAFEKAAEGDDVKVTKPDKKPVENTTDRAPEDGGRVF